MDESPNSYDSCTMGNCIDVPFHQPQAKSRVVIFNGGEVEFKASTLVKKITSAPYHSYKLVHHARPYSPLPPNAKLGSEEVYFLVPHLIQPCGTLVSPKMGNYRSCRRRRVKIVLSKKRFELLMTSAKEFQSKEIPVSSSESSGVGKRFRKWQPSLATIPEV